MAYFKPTKKDILGVIEMLRTTNCLPRYPLPVPVTYTEGAKQALNAQIAYFLFMLLKHENYKVNFSLLPRIAIYREIKKYAKYGLEESFSELFSNDATAKEQFLEYVNKKIKEIISSDFFDYLTNLENTFEMEIYKASTALATYIETLEIKQFLKEDEFNEIIKVQLTRLKKYKTFPVIRDVLENRKNNLFELFKNFSHLRKRVRWIKRVSICKHNVLAHSFDVAVINYLFCLNDNPKKLKRAEKGFCVGLFHDLAENWTGDIPSPMKNAIPGLKEKTQELERKTLENYVFPLIPEWLLPKFKGVMLEMLPSKKLRDFYKIADDFATTLEAGTQLMVGSNDKYFSNVVISAFLEKTPLTIRNKALNQIRKDASISYLDVMLYKMKHKTFW